MAPRPLPACIALALALLPPLSGQAAVAIEGSAPQREALAGLLGRLRKSPTGASLLRAVDGKVRLHFYRNPASALLDDRGELKLVSTSWARADASGPVVAIRLDENFLSAGLPHAAEVLAHELDHARSALAARRSGQEKLFYSFTDNEAHAVLTGSLTAWELGERPQSVEELQKLVESTAAYHEANAVGFSRGEGLSLEEMSDPIPVYRTRLDRARRERDALRKKCSEHMTWRVWAEHFVRVHGLDRARLHDIYEAVDAYLTLYRKDQLPTLESAAAHLEEILAYLETPGGRQWLSDIQRAPRQPFFLEFHRDVGRLRQRARAFLARGAAAAPEPGPEAPDPHGPSAPQMSYDELRELHDRDLQENPSHWR
ncbi:MAG: hypothetical protein A2X36_04560 [Elusimicrobia bacterium GWA2_69_24]|nr:MAG: hypothetical protein A2X36_04560 [Elusimicrobia bacterium GWA2_69_24]HBL16366.1 hypothetical protein [Elusimicrobiota bacterium]